MEEGEDLGLSMGEMSVDVAGVESAVAMRRKAVSDGRAVVVMFESRGVCRNTSLEKWWVDNGQRKNGKTKCSNDAEVT